MMKSVIDVTSDNPVYVNVREVKLPDVVHTINPYTDPHRVWNNPWSGSMTLGSMSIVDDIVTDILAEESKMLKYSMYIKPYFEIKKVIFNNPATIVYWKDGTKTVVKCGKDDTFDEEKGLALCFMKKALDNKSNYNNTFKKYIEEKK